MLRSLLFVALAVGAFLWGVSTRFGAEPTASQGPPASAGKPRPERGITTPRALGPVEPRRPTTPPVPGRDEPFSLPDPEPPEGMDAIRAEAYADALSGGLPGPGEQAFRAAVSAFVRHNRQFAERQASEEGLTVEEVEELTVFGFEAQHGMRWGEVEEVLGEPVSQAAREAASTLLDATNRAFKRRMRGLVDGGAPESERWALIAATQREYWAGYDRITGMDRDLFDALLAGDARRAYPTHQQPTPAQAAQRAPSLPPAKPERPEVEPPLPEVPEEEGGSSPEQEGEAGSESGEAP